MLESLDTESPEQRGKRDFAAGRYTSALENFRQAAMAYAAAGDHANQAEQRNNVGVTLLELGKPAEALESVAGTEDIFAANGDVRRQGIAINNRAAALEALHRPDEAIAAYEQAASLLGAAGERGLQTEALKAAAAVELRRGRLGSSGSKMLGALLSNPHPGVLDRVLRALLRLAR